MRAILMMLFMQIVSTTICCQVGSFVYVTATQLNIRHDPSLDSQVIGKLKLGDLVTIVSETNEHVTIDGIQGTWKEIEFNNVKGYVFSGYLSGSAVSFNDIDTFDIVFDMLYELNYNPTLNWYGIYSTPKGDKIEMVAPKPYINDKFIDLKAISFLQDTIKNYKFFIGTKEELAIGVVGVTTYYKDKWLIGKQSIDLILYSNEQNFLTGHKLVSSLVQLCDGIYGDKSFENYVLRYFNFEQVQHGESVIIYEPKTNYLNQIPTLAWYGDLDNDGLPEFLFFINGDNRGMDIEFIKIFRENNKLNAKQLISKRPPFAGGC